MKIPIYHDAVARTALGSGLDASVYGMLKQGLGNRSFASGAFMGRQFVHIVRSVMSQRMPVQFLVDLFPEVEAGLLRSYLEEGYQIALELPRPDRGGAASNWDCAIVYAAAKALQPTEIIETGTGVGATAYMALAASENEVSSREGTETFLTTFDREESITGDDAIPYYRWEELPLGGVGQLIKESDQHRVNFVLGDIRTTLPQWILDERFSPRTPILALVILDSLHTPEHQEFELSQVYPILADGSVILCDDTTYGWSSWIGSFRNCGFLGGIRK